MSHDRFPLIGSSGSRTAGKGNVSHATNITRQILRTSHGTHEVVWFVVTTRVIFLGNSYVFFKCNLLTSETTKVV